MFVTNFSQLYLQMQYLLRHVDFREYDQIRQSYRKQTRPRTVRSATTNSVSTSAPRIYPNSAKTPDGIAISWTSVVIAINPYFQEATGFETPRNAYATKRIIPSDTRKIARRDFRTNSRPTDGPIELKLSTLPSVPSPR
jgi:hypothetical protein